MFYIKMVVIDPGRFVKSKYRNFDFLGNIKKNINLLNRQTEYMEYSLISLYSRKFHYQ